MRAEEGAALRMAERYDQLRGVAAQVHCAVVAGPGRDAAAARTDAMDAYTERPPSVAFAPLHRAAGRIPGMVIVALTRA